MWYNRGMKKVIFGTLLSLGLAVLITSGSVFAACQTAILPESWCGEEGIWRILEFVIGILTVGVGILATVGLIISGIQYTTAGDSTEKTAKAKKRIFEIVIGLIAYSLLWAAANWLIPGGLV